MNDLMGARDDNDGLLMMESGREGCDHQGECKGCKSIPEIFCRFCNALETGIVRRFEFEEGLRKWNPYFRDVLISIIIKGCTVE